MSEYTNNINTMIAESNSIDNDRSSRDKKRISARCMQIESIRYANRLSLTTKEAIIHTSNVRKCRYVSFG